MKKLNFNIGWAFLIVIILIQFIFKGDYQFYAMIIALITVIPFFIIRLIKTYKDNPKEKITMISNMIMVLIFLIIGYLVITKKFLV
ncbi:hypothetical protein [Flavobacterium sp.]|uniref:hypothetical protein n=1 Tax=Flavobacterium sp. TaxID=239 RepID=UPI003750E56A